MKWLKKIMSLEELRKKFTLIKPEEKRKKKLKRKFRETKIEFSYSRKT